MTPADRDDSTILDYDWGSGPPAANAANYTMNIIATNKTHADVNCNKIATHCPVGNGSGDLTTPVDSNLVQVAPPPKWNKSGGVPDGNITKSRQAGNIPYGRTVQFSLDHINVNGHTGTVNVGIAETVYPAGGGGTGTIRNRTMLLEKLGPSEYFEEFGPQTDELMLIKRNNKARLQWKAHFDRNYTIDIDYDQLASPVRVQTGNTSSAEGLSSWESLPLYHSTAFTLILTLPSGVRYRLSTLIIVAEPDLKIDALKPTQTTTLLTAASATKLSTGEPHKALTSGLLTVTALKALDDHNSRPYALKVTTAGSTGMKNDWTLRSEQYEDRSHDHTAVIPLGPGDTVTFKELASGAYAAGIYTTTWHPFGVGALQ